MYQFDNIPEALRAKPNWLIWREELKEGRITKVPYSVYDGYECSVQDRKKLASFKGAVDCYNQWAPHYNGRMGIGYAFQKDEDVFGIDIDVKEGQQWTEFQIQVWNMFPDTYCEYSPSGTGGVHMIGIGDIPTGKRQNHVELYGSMRYFTFTGWQIQGREHQPLKDYHDQATLLWQMLGGRDELPIHQVGGPQLLEDQAVYEQIARSAVGNDFEQLWQGNWQQNYTDQSTADQALMNYMQFVTKNIEQLSRMFLMSGLGQRQKAKRRDYLERTIRKAFDLEPPPIDMSGVAAKMAEVLTAHHAKPVEHIAPIEQNLQKANQIINPYTFPPGILGEIAQFFYYQSPRPIMEVALAGAIAVMGGFCGKGYNVSNVGTNMYVLLLSSTGTGKDAIGVGFDRLLRQLTVMPDGIMPRVPAAAEFRGPSEISSGQGLFTFIAGPPPPKGKEDQPRQQKHSFVSIIGEFGIRMQQMAAQNASAADRQLERNLMQIYTRSGQGMTLAGIAYADRDKSVGELKSPAVSIFAETTPGTFWKGINEKQIENGLLPRFMMVDYTGEIVPLNRNQVTTVPEDMLQRIAAMLQISLSNIHQDKATAVAWSPEAWQMSIDFEEYSRRMANGSQTEVIKSIWTRTDLSVSKLAALCAIGLNPYKPTIDADCYAWAKALIVHGAYLLLKAFNEGKLSDNRYEAEQQDKVIDIFRRYFTAQIYSLYPRSGHITETMFINKFLPRSHVMEQVVKVSAFKQPGRSYLQIADGVLKELVNMGYIVRATDQAKQGLGITSRADGYFIGPDWPMVQ